MSYSGVNSRLSSLRTIVFRHSFSTASRRSSISCWSRLGRRSRLRSSLAPMEVVVRSKVNSSVVLVFW